MIDSLHILAKDDDVVKVVIGLVIGAIWLVSAIVGASKKQKPQGQPKPWADVLHDLGQMAGSPPPPPPPVQQQRQQRPPPMPGRPPQQQQKRKKKQQQARPQPVAAAKPAVQFEESSTHRVVEESQPIAVSSVGARAVPPTVSLGKTSMMLTPRTIREAMILTEVLGRPVSMREP